MAEFASKGVAGSALGLGIAGTALSLLNNGGNGNGGLLGILGSGSGYVSQNELAMSQALAAKDSEIGLLKADKYTDQKIVEAVAYVQGEMKELRNEVRANKDEQAGINLNQAVLNGTTNAAIGCINERVAELRSVIGGITKTVVPNGVICPGWGDVEVTIRPTSATTPTT